MSDDNNNLIPWNPAHFGHVDFKKESNGQLTIFFEDTNEPPDPDDFANLEAYEIAWIEWEQTQTLPQQEDKIMNFNITASFDSEIEQLKAKLAELETQKHRLATCANKIVEQVGECVIEMKDAGISDETLNHWACVIYKEITGQNIPAPSDSDILRGAITWEEKENRWYKEREELEAKVVDVDELIKERNEALQRYADLTAASLRFPMN